MTDYKMFVEVNQNAEFEFIEIQIRQRRELWAGYISAKAYIDFNSGELAFGVIPNVSFQNLHSPDEAREIGDWFRMGAATCEHLQAIIKNKDDLSRPVSAIIIGRSVIIDFNEK